MDVGFVVLCPDRNIAGIRNSLGSIEHHSYDRDAICVVPEDVSAGELKKIKEFLPVHKGQDTVTSLINVGMKKCKHDWAFLFFAGSRLPAHIEKKFVTWAKKDTDIIFPVMDRKCDFIQGSFNGVLMNTNFFKKAGDFPAFKMEKAGLNDFELAKMLWAINAVDLGVTFKAIVGMKII